MELQELVVAAGLILSVAIIAPLRAARAWRGPWRLAAVLPLALLLAMILHAALTLKPDRVSRGLFPFDVVLASVLAIMLTAVLRLAHALARARRGT